MGKSREAAKDKVVIKINVTPSAKAVIEAIAEQWGMKEFVVASTIYEWFAAQDDIFRRAVLGMLEGLEVDAARAFMLRLAGGGEDSSSSGGGKVGVASVKALRAAKRAADERARAERSGGAGARSGRPTPQEDPV